MDLVTREDREGLCTLTLNRLAATLHRCRGLAVEIGGHTDSQGRESTNMELSRARADAVLDSLLARNVPLEKMRAAGYGESQPIDNNRSEEGRALNRRIDIRLRPWGEDDIVEASQ